MISGVLSPLGYTKKRMEELGPENVRAGIDVAREIIPFINDKIQGKNPMEHNLSPSGENVTVHSPSPYDDLGLG